MQPQLQSRRTLHLLLIFSIYGTLYSAAANVLWSDSGVTRPIRCAHRSFDAPQVATCCAPEACTCPKPICCNPAQLSPLVPISMRINPLRAGDAVLLCTMSNLRPFARRRKIGFIRFLMDKRRPRDGRTSLVRGSYKNS